MSELSPVKQRLDHLKHTAKNGEEYWLAREIMPVLEYTDWRNFTNVIQRASDSLKSAGGEPAYHIVEVNRMVDLGSGADRKVSDFVLSKDACYLVTMNGDTKKRVIGEAQNYFVGQTLGMEDLQQWAEDSRRVELRDQAKDWNKKLVSTAKGQGVVTYGMFQDQGYQGLYNMGCADLKRRKGIPPRDTPLDHMDPEELGSNIFRITQTEAILAKQQHVGEEAAGETHYKVGKEIRDTIRKMGGITPEKLPKAEPIKEAKKRLKAKSEKKLRDKS